MTGMQQKNVDQSMHLDQRRLMQIEVPQWIKENRLTSKVTTTLVGGLTYEDGDAR